MVYKTSNENAVIRVYSLPDGLFKVKVYQGSELTHSEEYACQQKAIEEADKFHLLTL